MSSAEMHFFSRALYSCLAASDSVFEERASLVNAPLKKAIKRGRCRPDFALSDTAAPCKFKIVLTCQRLMNYIGSTVHNNHNAWRLLTFGKTGARALSVPF